MSRKDCPFLTGPPAGLAPLDHFYRRHVQAVLAYLLRRTGDRDLADDICAEVFAVAAAVRERSRIRRSFRAERDWVLQLAGDALRAGGLAP